MTTCEAEMAARTTTTTPVSAAKAEARLAAQPVVAEHETGNSDDDHGGVTDEIVMHALWGNDDDGQHGGSAQSTSLESVRDHAQRMITRVMREDPHTSYIALRSKLQDVRLFKVATLVAETPLEHERCDFRGVTRVPGSIDSVLEMLASEDERESYWVALNTQRGLLVNSLFATRRLQGAAPFPRWNQRYTATKFSKHTPPVECCFNEYAAFYPDPLSSDTSGDQELRLPQEPSGVAGAGVNRSRLMSQDTVASDGSPLRRAFVYRRSMDHRLFNMADVQSKLSKYGETCERLYLQDYLLEVSETSEKHICKVVLTCSVYITDSARDHHKNKTTTTSSNSNNQTQEDKHGKSMRHEFRESCALMLQSLRQVLSNQWREQMASAGVVASSSVSSTIASLSRAALTGTSSQSAAHHCGVCSTGFSLLKKRNVCHACALVVCSRCCTKQEHGSSLLLLRGSSQRTASTHDLNSRRATKECILCTQFGTDSATGGVNGGGNGARVSVSIRRHFTSSVFNSARSLTAATSENGDGSEISEVLSESGHGDDDDDDADEEVTVIEDPAELDDPVDLLNRTSPTQSKPPIRGNLRVRASTEDNTILTSAWRESSEYELLPPLVAVTNTATGTATTSEAPTRRRFKQRCESINIPSASSSRAQRGIVLLSDIETLSLTGSFHRLSTASAPGAVPNGSRSRLSSGASESSVASNCSSGFVRASPPLLPMRRGIRSVSEDTTLLPLDFQLDAIALHPGNNQEELAHSTRELDDLANFNLKLL